MALVLALYIAFVDRRSSQDETAAQSTALVTDFQRDQVSVIEITETNQPPIRLKKVNQLWTLEAPIHYPAQTTAAERWLTLLEKSKWVTRMSLKDVTSQGASLAEFGLKPPRKNITLTQGDRKRVIHLGNRLAVGKEVYLQVDEQPEIYIADDVLLDALPPNLDAWRDPSLFTFSSLAINKENSFDRVEMRPATNGYILQTDPLSGWRITRPINARADVSLVGQFLTRIIPGWHVEAFVSDDPNVDLTQFGLDTPAHELVIGRGTNDLLAVQFGQSPTNRPDLRYARLLRHTNVVLVARTNLDEWLRVPASFWRDRLLAHIDPRRVQEIVGSAGTTNSTYRLQEQTNGSWQIIQPEVLPADQELVTNFFSNINSVAIDFERDVVTDFGTYGLAEPARQFSFLAATNGLLTNVYATVSFGTNATGKAFARRSDETAVYSIDTDVFFNRLPLAYWQWRDRSIWQFQTNEVQKVRITDGTKVREVLHTPEGRWRLAPGSSGVVELSFDEAMFQFSSLRAERWAWVGNPDLGKTTFGFTNGLHQVSIEVVQNGVTRTNIVDFGGTSDNLKPYASVHFGDDRTWFFEFPPTLYYQFVKNWFQALEKP